MRLLLTVAILTIAYLMPAKSYSQGYYHATGMQYNFGTYSLSYVSPSSGYFSGSTTLALPGVLYKGTYSFNKRLAVSGYPFLGFILGFNSRVGGGGSLGFSLPVNAELYLGDIEENCFILGGGFAYHYLKNSNPFYGQAGGTVLGPQVAVGGQLRIRERLVGLRIAYTNGINKARIDDDAVVSEDRKSMLSIGMFYPIGQ